MLPSRGASLANYCDRYIYMTGGKFEKYNSWHRRSNDVLESEVVKKVHIFDIENKSVTMAPEMQKSRYFHGSAILGNRLYVYAGFDGENIQQTMEVLTLIASIF